MVTVRYLPFPFPFPCYLPSRRLPRGALEKRTQPNPTQHNFNTNNPRAFVDNPEEKKKIIVGFGMSPTCRHLQLEAPRNFRSCFRVFPTLSFSQSGTNTNTLLMIDRRLGSGAKPKVQGKIRIFVTASLAGDVRGGILSVYAGVYIGLTLRRLEFDLLRNCPRCSQRPHCSQRPPRRAGCLFLSATYRRQTTSSGA